MEWVLVLGWLGVALGVGGFIVGLRNSYHNDDIEKGLLLWMVVAWTGVGLLIATEVA